MPKLAEGELLHSFIFFGSDFSLKHGFAFDYNIDIDQLMDAEQYGS